MIVTILILLFQIYQAQSQLNLLQLNSDPKMLTPFEKNENYSASYDEVISYYKMLDSVFVEIQLTEWGMTDSGIPLHEVILDLESDFNPGISRNKNKSVLMINNGIHPGEPCGIDASMMLARDLLSGSEMKKYLSNLVIVIVPVYNIGGSLNRSSHSRANQNGPEFYGFRGNAKNYDLNRDFIKCNSKNAQGFIQLFAKWDPDILVDTHTSNGADYTYTMTLVSPQKDKFEEPLKNFLSEMSTRIYKGMAESGWEMIPYVYSRWTPDNGIYGFNDSPRYSSGYAALHQTLGFMSEAHMLKPFGDRVKSTYELLFQFVRDLAGSGATLMAAREECRTLNKTKSQFDIKWTLDGGSSDTITFKGYEAKTKNSVVSGKPRLYYDRTLEYEKQIPFYNNYIPEITVLKPSAYIIPQAYEEIVDRLKWNGVRLFRLKSNIEVKEAQFYYITDYSTSENAYEGHYLHSDVQTRTVTLKRLYYKGDYLAILDQKTNRFMLETLEPSAPDSYFSWNFFDAVLMQKEGYSSYVFEDIAFDILARDSELQSKFETKKSEDEKFADDPRAQLDFIYKNSTHYEKTHNLYPIAKVFTLDGIPFE